MSALRRSGYGPSDGPSYGRYYGPGGGDVPMHPPPPLYPPRPEPPQPPISWRVRGGGPAETTWPGEGGGGDGYYASAGAWSETGRAGGSHQVSFAPSVPGGSDKGSLGWGLRAIGIDKPPEFIMDRVSYLFSLWEGWRDRDRNRGGGGGICLCSLCFSFPASTIVNVSITIKKGRKILR